MSKPKTAKTDHEQEKPDIASRNFLIIARRCNHWHAMLPQSARNHYDVDDMIGDVVLHVMERAARYDPAKSQESTWVWMAADNKCGHIIQSAFRQKRHAVEVELDRALAAEGEGTTMHDVLADPVDRIARSHSLDAVERVIEAAYAAGDDEVLRLVSRLVDGGFERSRTGGAAVVVGRETFAASAVEKLGAFARRRGAGFEDFMSVLQNA